MVKKIPFKNAQFVTSALSPEEWPSPLFPEIPIIGRSNAGKSTLINHLLETKNLAKTSSKPGKTRRLNFFTIDSTFTLVDLPGYGYAAASKKEQKTWSHYLDHYLKNRRFVALLFLCDIRRALDHSLSEEDKIFLDWTTYVDIPFVCILTKADKLSKDKQTQALASFQQIIQPSSLLLYSIKQGKCRSALRSLIETLLSQHRSSPGVMRCSR